MRPPAWNDIPTPVYVVHSIPSDRLVCDVSDDSIEPAELHRIADSIDTHGVEQAIVVEADQVEQSYRVIRNVALYIVLVRWYKMERVPCLITYPDVPLDSCAPMC